MYMYQQQSSSRRLIGIGVVVLFHIALVYALVTGLGGQITNILHPPIQTKLIQEVKPPPPDVPLPPPPLAAPPPPYIPPPEIQVSPPMSSNAITAVSHQKPPEAPPAPVAAAPPPAVHVAPRVQVGKSCRTPEYPAASRVLGETGTVVLRFLVDVTGKVIQSEIETSSGHPRLDEAARAALSLCSFTPGTVDGKQEQSWARLRYVWKMD